MEDNKKDKMKFGEADEKETKVFLKLLKTWLTKYSDLDETLNITPSRDLSTSDIIRNKKKNFARVKIFIDYFEMSMTVPSILKSMERNFSKFTKFVLNLTQKILISSEKVNKDTSLFADFILVNYPNITSKLTHSKFKTLLESKGGIVGFKRAFVMKIKPASFLLWNRVIFFTCDCKGNKGDYIKKTINIFKNNHESNSIAETFCSICKKEYVQDNNGDILIECQEMLMMIDSEVNNVSNNIISVWCYGDLINSAKEGDCLSLVGFHIQSNSKNSFEKDFSYGSFIALNFNMYFSPLNILKEKNFLNGGNNFSLSNKNNFSLKFNENCELDILRRVVFKKQLSVNMLKMIVNNYLSNSTKFHNSHEYNFFVHFVLDMSIAQRDYLNKSSKFLFLQDESENNTMQTSNVNDQRTSSNRNILLKSKIFENNNKSQRYHQEEDLKKHFRFSRQIDYQRSINNTMDSSILNNPLNILIIFDDITKDNLNVITDYAKAYSSLISIYPIFNTNKFNKEAALKYFFSANNGIVVIPNLEILSKNEADMINCIVQRDSAYENLNIAFWICETHNKITARKSNKNIPLDEIESKCEVVLNMSKRFNKFRGIEKHRISEDKSKLKIANFATDFSGEDYEREYLDISNIKYNEESLLEFKILKAYNQGEIIEEIMSSQCTTDHFYVKEEKQTDFNDSFSAAKLMEDYFLIKRNLFNVKFDDMMSILRLSIFSSMLRKNSSDSKILFPRTITNINYLDVILTIFLYEEYSIYKYGMESTSFGNLVAKIIHSEFTDDIVSYVNQMKRNSAQIKPMIPQTKSSLKKLNTLNHSSYDKSKDQDCARCNQLLKFSFNSQIEEFLERLTIFTYNN